ncbi:6-phosphogluconolactonase [Phycicoccus duodecadis]|uniref:6-phosphogluconolactonase n=1 Tax=Phycicoccus duodecadis TaxID=173053 RepID=A0A2N3YEI8_9MICO|nr:6-phosphogluconolactonase [Phycicoccus duodecadis]PKW25250.1 6-phosphogluconolactonase [Phycicoccus duodecadis]
MTGPHACPDATVVVHPTRQALADAAAARLVVALVDALAVREVAHVSMTGGSMGSEIVRSLVALPARDAVDWGRVHVWWGDERYLPAGDPDRNDTQNDAAGLSTLCLDPANVHRVPGPDATGSAEEAAATYAHTVRSTGTGAFDVMVLGVGPDGHIASLFPHHPAAGTQGEIAVAVHDSPKPPPDRVSLTLECLERSREVWFLVSGADKADAVRRGVQGSPFAETPAAHVRGQERTLWLVDHDAAADLG